MLYALALLIGVVAGSRAMMAPAAVTWAAWLGRLHLKGSWLEFLSSPWACGIFTLLALIELVTDQLPTTPSRTVPVQFAARLVTGGLSGLAIGAGYGSQLPGLFMGLVGAIIGTFGGRALRGWLAKAFANDHPAALVEDAIALAGAAVVMVAMR
jgi:uncharacterized membrane protein